MDYTTPMRKNIRQGLREQISFWNKGIGAIAAAAAVSQHPLSQERAVVVRTILGTDTRELNAPSNFTCIRARQCFPLGLEQMSRHRIRCFRELKSLITCELSIDANCNCILKMHDKRILKSNGICF